MKNEAKKQLIWLYGAKCMLTDLATELNYHHLHKKCDGGKETVENGAILSRGPHTWLHKLEESDIQQYRDLNEALKCYKICLEHKKEFALELEYYEIVKEQVKKKNKVR